MMPSSFYQVYYTNRIETRLKEYLAKDVEITNDLVKGIRPGTKYPTKVIYSGNKTIVFWNDKTKTIVSCGDGDQYDPYAGFCVAYEEDAQKDFYRQACCRGKN